MKKTTQLKSKEISREWHLLDADSQVLGRFASNVAKLLMGKNKITYTPHMDMGDYVVILNAEKIVVTGKKAEQKVYYRHSGFPGGLKEVSYAKLKKEQPEKIIKMAVAGMLPKNRLRKLRLKRLKF